jgi:hypothetical protein
VPPIGESRPPQNYPLLRLHLGDRGSAELAHERASVGDSLCELIAYRGFLVGDRF